MIDVMERKIKLKTVNPCITCILCKGYLVEATTITECLHTFCKTCIVKYLEEHTKCPQCDQLIHQSHPLNYISHDRTMQDIVYKLVPNLYQNEKDRELEFYRLRGLTLPTSLSGSETPPPFSHNNNIDKDESTENSNNADDCHRTDEQVNVCLECCSTQQLKRRFIRCSSQATITHLKKYIALKLYHDTQRYTDVEILCNEEPLGKDHTLKFITVTRWRAKNRPLALTYRPKMDL